MPTIRYAMLEMKSVNMLVIWVFLIILSINFGISINALLKVQKLENDLRVTKQTLADLFDLNIGDEDANDNAYEDNNEKPPLKLIVDKDEDYYENNYVNEEDNYLDVTYDDLTDDLADTTNKSNSESKQLSKLLKDLRTKLEAINERKKREILSATSDGVIIKSESYADFKRKNLTKTTPGILSSTWYYSRSPTSTKSTLRYYDFQSTSSPITSRRSRVMHVDDKAKPFKKVIRRPIYKSLSDIQEQVAGPEMTIIHDNQMKVIPHRKRNRQRLDSSEEPVLRFNRMRPQPAIHFSGDTSKYVLGMHHNFKGNGHLRHHSKTFVDWKSENWVKSLGMDQYFSFHNGDVTIKDPGLYFVYAQIYYLDEHDTNGYRIHKNSEVLFQCTTMTHSVERVTKGNTCYTGGVAYLSDGDKIRINDLSDSRYSLFEPGKSFFGIIKLGEIKIR